MSRHTYNVEDSFTTPAFAVLNNCFQDQEALERILFSSN